MDTGYLYSDVSHRDIDAILSTLKNTRKLQQDIRLFYEKLKNLKINFKFMDTFEKSGLQANHYKELYN